MPACRLTWLSGVGVCSRPYGVYDLATNAGWVSVGSRARRLALYDEMQRRHALSEPLIAIARAMNMARGTVRTYAHASSFPERGACRPGHSIRAGSGNLHRVDEWSFCLTAARLAAEQERQ